MIRIDMSSMKSHYKHLSRGRSVLQDNLLKYKQITEKYKQKTEIPRTPSPPRLTKKRSEK